ncbi:MULTISPECIES: NUDIX domain-containing protein [Coprococcus]|jgi:isopentenyldiphosphate isomerase|uniref:NUDIX domain-containing protein n=1 Tax=Coprococcus TaxID=33042 RepID=UPI000E771ECB|nr:MULTISPECIES: NUDIX domain-containing protein [Coprococcus]RJW74919.1 NUDIX domain-containing protein [Coprococcus sp. AF38-1]
MDRIDLYDEQKKIVKTCMFDKGNIPKGLYYYTVHIWIYNCKKGFLIQQRSKYVKNLPERWTTTSGTVLHMETPIMAAYREVKEELGIEINIDNLKLIYQYKKNQHFVDVFLIEMNIELGKLCLQELEVGNVKFASKIEIQKMVEGNEFYKYIYLPILNIRMI